LTSATIPNSLTSIADNMFNDCEALTTVIIPTSVTSIGEFAFNYCTALSSVTIPASVRSIGNSAFYYCTSLASIYANSSTPANITLGSDVFYSVPSTCKLYVPTGFNLLYAAASQWSAFSNITETNSNSVSVSINPSTAGSVIGIGSCLQSSSCILTATPVTGYAFINWTDKKGNIISNSANITFTSIQDTSFIANFELSTNVRNITTICSPPAGGTVSGSGNYYTGTTRTVTATVNKGYTFANWTNNKGTILSTLPGFTFPLTQDTTLTANFTAYKYTVNAAANLSEGGNVTGGGTYNYGTIITVSAIPNTCYEFKNWTNNKGYVVSTSPSVTFTLGNDTTLTAKFVRTYDFADANGLYYKISSPTSAYVCSRSPNVGFFNSNITIPSSFIYKDVSYNITAIGDSAFYNCYGLESISIPNSVTSIGNWAFYRCYNLARINVPESVAFIGNSAFDYCAKITSITIPNAITSIANRVFSGCSSLTSIIIPGSVTSIGDNAFDYCLKLTTISIPNSVNSIGNSAFYRCSNLTSITIPASVDSMANNAFGSCTGLTSITVDSKNPNYCSVEGVLFNKNKTSLIQYPIGNTQTSYSVPNTVSTIGDAAFANASELTSVTFSSSVTTINRLAFFNCIGLTAIYANNSDPGKIKLGIRTFDYVPTTTCKIFVPTGSKTLYAAADQWKAFSIVEQENIYSIFANSSLAAGGEVAGSGVYSSGASCTLTATPATGYDFSGWTENGAIISSDVSYTFPVSATRTLVANFKTLITASASPTNYGSVAGVGNYVLGSSCTLTATPTTGYVFSNWTENGNVVSTSATYTFTVSATRTLVANFAPPCILSLSANSIEGGVVTGSGTYGKGSSQTVTATPNDGYGFKSWVNNKGIVLSTSKSYSFTLTQDTTLTANFAKTYDFVDNNGLYYKISSPTTAYVTYRNSAGGDYSGNITIPSTATINGTSYNVTAIGDSAFYNCSGLTSISFASSVTAIGYWAFYHCFNLRSITIPNSVTSIGNSAFSSCYNLMSITISNAITSIGNDVFGGCSSLTSITIPNSVTSIGKNAFYHCDGLTTITIPNSVTSIGSWAFAWCKGLTSVSVPNSVTSIGEYAFYNSESLTAISIPSSVTFIDNMAFADCSKLSSITVDSYNPNYSSYDGVLFNKALTSLIQYPAGKSNTSYNIPSKVTSIGANAFDHVSALLTITIPNPVSSIGTEAFYYSKNLNSIYVYNTTPANIKLDNNAFYSVPTVTCTLYVPTGSKTLYAAASQWKAFANIVELPLYTITASANALTGGNISGAGSCLSSSQCTISAVPNTGYSFANWTENGTVVSTDASYIFTVTANRTLVANFTENNAGDYIIAMSANPSAGGSTTGTGRYASGATCIALATAKTGYLFSNWTENGTVVSKDMTYTFTVNAARTLVANFITGYAVTAVSNSSTGGSVTGAGGYATGASCTLTATANTGYIFSNWAENGTVASTNATYTFTVNAAHTCIANFVPGFIINATADASQGNITGTGGYATGSSCTLKAAPKTGYVFTGWTENGTVVSTNPSYTFAVSAARSLVANFSTVTVAVTQPTAATLSGSITVTPSTGFTYSIDGKTYQSSNEFPYVSIGTYNVTLKNLSDGTVSSPVLAVVNASGVVAANNYQIKALNCTCRDTKDGAIAVTLAKALDYTVTVTGINTGTKQSVMFSGTSYNLKNLPADTYKLVFKIDFLDNYEQSFNIVVTQPDDLSVLKVGAEKSRATYALSGGTNYYVSVNDNTTETQGDQVLVSLVPGENKIKIYTEKLCQGMYEETIYNSENGQISLFPNPTTGKITLGIPGEEESVTAEIISLSGAVELKQKLVVPSSRLVDLDVSDFSSGTYIVKVNGSTVHSSVKMVKK